MYLLQSAGTRCVSIDLLHYYHIPVIVESVCTYNNNHGVNHFTAVSRDIYYAAYAYGTS